MEPEEVQHLRSGQRKRCWGGCRQGEGAPGASSGDKRVDFQEEGTINHQMRPMKEREARVKARALLSREYRR